MFFALGNHVKQFRQIRIVPYLFAVLVLILFAGLRAPEVTADYGNYVFRFEMVPHLGYWLTGEFVYSFREVWMEPGYIAVGAFIKTFTDNHVWMFLGVAFLSVGIAAYSYYQYTPLVFLTLLLFFVHTYFYRDMTQIRSAVAAAVGLFLIAQLYNKQYVRSLFTIGLASLFHMAALSLLLAYVASFVRLTRKRVFWGLIAAVVLGVVGVSGFLLQILPGMGYITVKLEGYAGSKYAESVSLFDITNIKNLAVMCFVLLFWNRLERKVPYFKILALFMFMATAWRVAFSDFGIFAARIATFFGIVEVLLVAAFVLIFRQKIVASLAVILYAFSVFYLNLEKKLNPYELAFSIF